MSAQQITAKPSIPPSTLGRFLKELIKMESLAESLPTLCARFKEQRMKIGHTTALSLATAIGVVPSTISKIERGVASPSASVLSAFLALGADVHYVLSGVRTISSDRYEELWQRAYSTAGSRYEARLNQIFGTNTEYQTPDHLLGASLYLLNANAAYQDELNPYPPSSPHHAGVATGWRMAQAAMSGVAAPLPGTL